MVLGVLLWFESERYIEFNTHLLAYCLTADSLQREKYSSESRTCRTRCDRMLSIKDVRCNDIYSLTTNAHVAYTGFFKAAKYLSICSLIALNHKKP